MSKRNSNYYKKTMIPIRNIKSSGGIPGTQKEKRWGLLGLLKKSVNLILMLALLSSQVYLFSAFEAQIINVTAHICAPSETRTMGFWKNHPENYLNCLPQWLGNEEINSTTTVNEVFDNANADIMRDMLKGQLLAMKFNICYFIGNDVEGEEFNGMTLYELVAYADDLLRDPNATREELEEIKNLLDYLNNLHYIKYCAQGIADFSGGVSIMLSDEYSVGWVSDYLFVADQSIDKENQPETFITAHPQSETEDPEAYFAFGSSKQNATFQCKLNFLDWINCDSPKTYYGLNPGEHQFQVFATDQMGNYDRTPAVFSWPILEVEQPFIEPPAEEPPEPYCGDGIIDEGEQCDDSNIEDGDGCSASCTLEEVPLVAECELEAQQLCSTGLLGICAAGTQICSLEGFWGSCLQDEEPVSEICDNELDNDCDGSTDCDDEDCLGAENCPLPPEPYCGDGNIDEGEECDTGENNGAECTPEYGSSCDYCSLTCETITLTGPYCGDGIVNGEEACEEDLDCAEGMLCNSCLCEEAPPQPECEAEATTACSTGFLGICEAGTQTCSLDGFWEECLSDNQPTDEVCDNELDDNCDGNVDCDDVSCAEDEFCLPPAEE